MQRERVSGEAEKWGGRGRMERRRSGEREISRGREKVEKERETGSGDLNCGAARGGGKNAGWRLQGRMKEVDGDQENYFWSGNVGAGEGERKADNAGNGRIFGVCRHSLFCRKFITTTVFFQIITLVNTASIKTNS